MTAQRSRRKAVWGLAVVLGALVLVPARLAAAPGDVDLGLGGRVVAGRTALLRVAPADLPDGATFVRVAQDYGNAWRGEGTSVLDLPLTPSDAGGAETAVPIYDASLPMRVTLLAADRTPLAERTIDLRARRAEAPLVVAVGAFPPGLGGLDVRLAAAELPHVASGYDAAASVWIGRAADGLDAGQWDALARWVLAGGSLVVFTGADFLLLDAPRLRELLPIRDPAFAAEPSGERLLTGQPRVGTTVLLEREGRPDAVAGRFGAGTVVWVSRAVGDLGPGELQDLRPLIPDALHLPVTDAAAALLDGQALVRPSPWIAVLLAVLAVTALPVLARRSGRRIPVSLGLVGGFLALSALAWALTSGSRVESEVCRTDLRVMVSNSRSPVSAVTACSALAATSRGAVEARVEAASAPYEVLPERFPSGTYNLRYDGETRLTLRPGEPRLLTERGAAPALLQVVLAGDEGLRVRSRLTESLIGAVLWLDGQAYRLPEIAPNATTALVGTPVARGAARPGDPGSPLDHAVASLGAAVALDRGAWLVAGRVEKERGTQTVTVYIVEVDRG